MKPQSVLRVDGGFDQALEFDDFGIVRGVEGTTE
jgi:hypothetical protein